MFWINGKTAVPNCPSPREATSKVETFATFGDPGISLPATVMDADWVNMMQSEMMNLIRAGKQVPDQADKKQVLKAIRNLIGSAIGIPNWTEEEPEEPTDNPLAEIMVEAGLIFPGFCLPFSGTFQGKNPINPKTNKAVLKWHICDGTDNTPDLRDKFVIGSSTTKAAGTTGGTESHKHTGKGSGNVGATTLTTTQIPAHNHSVNTRNRASVAEGKNEYDHWGGVLATTTGNAGGGQSHTHSATSLDLTLDDTSTLPPYFALAYIMRMS